MTNLSVSSGPSLWKFLSRAVVLWVGSFLFVLGCIFTGIGLNEAAKERPYQSSGVAVDATVTEKTIDRAKRGGNPRTRYLVSYQFASPEGRKIEGSGEVSVEEWERLNAGKKVPVTYLRNAPASSRIQGSNDDAWIAVYVFLAIGGVFTLLGGGLAVYEGRTVVRTIQVSRHGLPTQGTVLRVEPTSTSINRVRQWRLRYRYRDHVGRTQDGESHLLSPDEASVWQEGDTGTVRFDRERPQDSVWMGHA
jgi:uncharacterized protein DUF3592